MPSYLFMFRVNHVNFLFLSTDLISSIFNSYRTAIMLERIL